MLLMTAFKLAPTTGNFIFVGGSDMLMSLVSSNFLVSITFGIAFFIIVFFYQKARRKVVIPLLILIFLLWFLSGRMIALFPDGRIITGWFYIQTNRSDICRTDIDCEKVFRYDTRLEKLSVWRLRVSNSEIDVQIFTGPFIWRHSQLVFENEFPSGHR